MPGSPSEDPSHTSIDAPNRHSLPSQTRKNPHFVPGRVSMRLSRCSARPPGRPSSLVRICGCRSYSLPPRPVRCKRRPSNSFVRRRAPAVCGRHVTVLLRLCPFSVILLTRLRWSQYQEPPYGLTANETSLHVSRSPLPAQKRGVVWHNDAGEKDETVFTPFIGARGPKSPVFFCPEFRPRNALARYHGDEFHRSDSIASPPSAKGLSRGPGDSRCGLQPRSKLALAKPPSTPRMARDRYKNPTAAQDREAGCGALGFC